MSTPRRTSLATWMLRIALRHRGGLSLLALLMLVEAALLAASPWPMKIIIDHVLADPPVPMPRGLIALLSVLPGADDERGIILWMVAGTIVLFAATACLGLLQATLSATVGQRMVYQTAGDVFAKLQRLSLSFHAKRSVGDSMRRITGDCACIATIIRDSVLPLLAALVTVSVMVIIMVRLNLVMTLVALIALPLLMLAIRRLTPPVLERGYTYAQAEAGVWTIAERTLSAVPVVQAFRAEARTDKVIQATYEQVFRSAVALTWSQFNLKILTGMITAVAAAALLFTGAREVLADRLSVGGLLVFLAYLAALYAPMTAVVHAASSASQAAGGARRVLELLDEVEEVSDAPGALPLELRGPPPVVFDHITFGYAAVDPVLANVNLEVASGQTVAIVGPSGAGKSTLVAMIPRLFDPQGGRVLIGGQDIRSVTLRSLRERVAILLQDTYLFPVSIADNIAYARPGASLAEVEEAARAAGAHQFITRLPDGYSTPVGQRGATLSGGERQRIAIARALLKDAPVLILDEPTSALDAETEAGLLEALDRLRAGRTTFIIAHRLSTVRSADLIIMIESGRIVERGTHAQLLAAGGAYARLHDLQFGKGRS
jgi:ATP-binding cassette, subfamily B, bacterial